MSLPEIFVDADACPVKAEVERVAQRHGLVVHIVSNGGIRPNRHPLFRHVTVAAGPDAADDWIAEHAGAGDIVVTADIPLAARCLKKRARVLGPTGKVFAEGTIGLALGMRDFNKYLREASGKQTYNATFGKDDRSRFLNALENEIQAAKRVKPITNAEMKTMREEQVRIKTADGVADGFLYVPDGKGPWPAISRLPRRDRASAPPFTRWPKGLRAKAMWCCCPTSITAPHPARRSIFRSIFGTWKTRQRFGELTAPLTQDAMERDAFAYLDVLGAHSEAKGAMGVVGYCLTGKMALYTAAAAPARIAAAAAFHGGGLYTDDDASPHHVLPRIKVRDFISAMRSTTIRCRPRRSPNSKPRSRRGAARMRAKPIQRGMAGRAGWEIYDEAQAERAYAKMKALFAETLR